MKLSTVKAVLATIKKHCPSAIVAGGALRDIEAGIEPKDIDVFIKFEDEPSLPLACNVTVQYDMSYAEVSEVEKVYSTMDFAADGLPTSVGAQLLNWIDVQIIVLRPGFDPIERARHNDFASCQVWLADPADDGVCATPEYWSDIRFGTFSLLHCENLAEFERSMRRWARLKDKFRDRVLHIPQRHLHYATAENCPFPLYVVQDVPEVSA